MTLGMVVMAALGTVAAAIGTPVLLRPATVRRLLGLRDTPQMVYVLRIAGTMLAALGLILILFAIVFAAA